jgi:hypothetical protein
MLWQGSSPEALSLHSVQATRKLPNLGLVENSGWLKLESHPVDPLSSSWSGAGVDAIIHGHLAYWDRVLVSGTSETNQAILLLAVSGVLRSHAHYTVVDVGIRHRHQSKYTVRRSMLLTAAPHPSTLAVSLHFTSPRIPRPGLNVI